MIRSRVSSIARPRIEVSEPEVTEGQAEGVLEAITEDAPETAPEPTPISRRGGIREPAQVTHFEPAIEQAPAQDEAPKRRGPKPGSTRKAKAVEKIAEDVMPVEAMAAPQVRAQLKELEGEIKEAHARHASEMQGLRTKYRALHDRLFDLTK